MKTEQTDEPAWTWSRIAIAAGILAFFVAIAVYAPRL